MNPDLIVIAVGLLSLAAFIYAAFDALADRRRRRRLEQAEVYIIGWDLGAGGDGRYTTVTTVSGIVDDNIVLRRDIETVHRQIIDTLDRALAQSFDYSGEKTQKSLELLKSWLSPVQLEQYQNAMCFDVVGNWTGKRYRINPTYTYNIEDYGLDGELHARLCVVPGGDAHALGDIMLAQKIALERNERRTLRIAHRWAAAQMPPILQHYNCRCVLTGGGVINMEAQT